MARVTKPLTDTEIRQAKPRDKEYNLADGKNLYLRVRTTGSKVWILNYYRPGTRQRANLGLGSYPDVPLQTARKKASELRAVLADGIDPKEHREDKQRAQAEQYANTFESVARKWLQLKKVKVSSAYYEKISDRLEKYVFPKMGQTPIHSPSAGTGSMYFRPITTHAGPPIRSQPTAHLPEWVFRADWSLTAFEHWPARR